MSPDEYAWARYNEAHLSSHDPVGLMHAYLDLAVEHALLLKKIRAHVMAATDSEERISSFAELVKTVDHP